MLLPPHALLNPVSPFPAAAIVILALATCGLIVRWSGAPRIEGRFVSIDGLRGYLALLVFVSHGCLWYFFLRTQQWVVPPSRLYTHMGQGAVTMFFMITAFLFFSKLLEARGGAPIDWTRWLVGRVLRLAPLYLCAVLVVFVITAGLTHATLHESLPRLVKHGVQWLAFSVPGPPDLNGLHETRTLMAGVTWSLPYEWAFYLALPLLALSLGIAAPGPVIAFSLLSVAAFLRILPEMYWLLPFVGGLLAAGLARSPRLCRLAATRAASLAALTSIGIAVACFPTAKQLLPLGLLSFAFVIIACGNSLFGLLTHPASRTLGQMSYSVYLLHGLILFAAFKLVLGLDAARALTAPAHWLLILALTPVVIGVCYASFRLIEQPAMRSTTRVTSWLRARAGPPRAASGLGRLPQRLTVHDRQTRQHEHRT